ASVGGHRAPRRILHVTGRRGETLAHPAVARDRGELAATGDLGFVKDHLTVRGVAGRIVEVAVGENRHLPGGELHRRDVIAVAVTHDVHDVLAVRAEAGTHVVRAVEGDALRRAARSRHTVDLRRAAAVRGECD